MAQIIVSPDRPIEVDDSDFEELSKFRWRKADNVSGKVARVLPNGRVIGLAATLAGKRPTQTHRLIFVDKNLRNFRRDNLQWTNACELCGRRVDMFGSICLLCETDVHIGRRCKKYDRLGGPSWNPNPSWKENSDGSSRF